MSTDYIGIDYGNRKANIDLKTGIRYGVICQNSVMSDALQDIMDKGKDVAFENAKAACVSVVKERVQHWFNNESWLNRDEKKMRADFRKIVLEGVRHSVNSYTAERIAEDTVENWGKTSTVDEIMVDAESAVDAHFGDSYESDNGLNDYVYEEDGYQITGCLTNDIIVIRSLYYTYAQFCSPCVPGAGNLDNAMSKESGAAKTYCLFHDWFEGGKAPYRLWRVEDDVEILMRVEETVCPSCKGSGRDTVARVEQVRGRGISDEELGREVQFPGLNREDRTFTCFRCENGKVKETQYVEADETQSDVDAAGARA